MFQQKRVFEGKRVAVTTEDGGRSIVARTRVLSKIQITLKQNSFLNTLTEQRGEAVSTHGPSPPPDYRTHNRHRPRSGAPGGVDLAVRFE